ncbi:putative retinal dehydrogenase [Schistosoma mansoni]|uniref:putative retinal dehydrogenase n=1 Tax=Schistosoma mansoni TaxID=6183 RepID=UPI00022DCB8B|nr:putative retinal dehydrogenase [Schistosoma mansoni]|eukprot:XP_018655463.1 putative retinal dehydrogenase [Schistosoma mansoni]
MPKIMKETIGSWRKLCIINKRLDGKIAIVTGCNTGIGFYTASELARRGATIIMACRNMERANEARTRLLEMYGENNAKSEETDVACSRVKSSLKHIESDQLLIEQLDLASLKSIREFADRIKSKYNKIDFLINNAGLILQNYTTTEDGFEMTMGVNYFGPFLLTELLLPLLKNAASSRIINVSSMIHERGRIIKPDLQYDQKTYDALNAYSTSKLANVIHAIELSERLKDCGVVAVSLHPGIVNTEVMRDMTSFPSNILRLIIRTAFTTPWKGAQTTLYTALTENLIPGSYYSNCTLKTPSKYAQKVEDRKWFWNKTCELLNIKCDN